MGGSGAGWRIRGVGGPGAGPEDPASGRVWGGAGRRIWGVGGPGAGGDNENPEELPDPLMCLQCVFSRVAFLVVHGRLRKRV